MFDCANVEMRELLPELAAGTLDGGTRARVEAHLAACAECASELETLRLVKSAYANTPAVDVRRIVSALPKPATAPRIAGGAAPVKRWMDWRIAAALTMITVGGLSVAVSERVRTGLKLRSPDSIAIVTPGDTVPTTVKQAPVLTPAPGRDSGTRTAPPVRPPTAKAQLAFGGGVDDLDDASLRALMGALDEIDRAPVAPSAEPDPSPMLPVIKEGQR